MNLIDHIALGAADLQTAKQWLKEKIGIEVPDGGKHEAMSTHNCLCQAHNNQYFEIIAIDPTAPPPNRARWFGLDSASVQSRLQHYPSPLAWIVSTTNLEQTVANSPVDLGEIVELSRDDLSWKVTVKKDGSLNENGVIPIFIEWPDGINPSSNMPNLNLSINSINLRHPDPGYINDILAALKVDHLANILFANDAGIEFNLSTDTHTNVTIT